MEYRQNEQLRLAAEFVQYTSKNIFLTGKAGTGKTTFLHNLRKITPKRIVVVAPTGVAAINAGGVTIHSFFQLSFAPAIPGTTLQGNDPSRADGFQRKFSRDKIRLIKCIDLLVIDEISMVRADVLDAVDEVLRKYRNHAKPFGGVQLLMIGDLHQLSPVIRDEEWNILRNYYNSIYFFESRALKQSDPVTIELKEIFRQSDAVFISLLNKVRENKIDNQTITQINERHVPGFMAGEDEGYITLTTHNASAININKAKLAGIPGKSYFFNAEIEREFPQFNFPTEEKLELKIMSQVMFIKNDLSPEKQYYNGKIGRIIRIEDGAVFVKCPSEDDEIEVGPVKWENIKYSLDEVTKEIREEVAGSFTQIPLKLAWAITIHKSQGLTFDRVIIDANAAFAFGQVYVALSRCRTFGGIVLSTPIAISGIKTDTAVLNYSNDVHQKEPGPELLSSSKFNFQRELFLELFDFSLIKYRLGSLAILIRENAKILDPGSVSGIRSKEGDCEAVLFKVAEKFKPQLNNLMAADMLPEENPGLQQRARQAAQYFADQVKTHLVGFTAKINLETDNRAVKKLLAESIEKLDKDVFIKLTCLEIAKGGFGTLTYIKARSDAEVDYRPAAKQNSMTREEFAKSITHPELYAELRKWRDGLADENDIPAYMILPQKSMMEIINKLPITLASLKTIKGIGQAKLTRFGSDILSIIEQYCSDYDIMPKEASIQVARKKTVPDTAKVSYEMFRSGKSVLEIAYERTLTANTIEGHLARFVGSGEISINEFVSADKISKVEHYILENSGKSRGEIKSAMGNAISYAELNYILQHLRHRS